MMQHTLNAFLFQGNLGMEIQVPGKVVNDIGNRLYLLWSNVSGA
jgi:hypothetical protein